MKKVFEYKQGLIWRLQRFFQLLWRDNGFGVRIDISTAWDVAKTLHSKELEQ